MRRLSFAMPGTLPDLKVLDAEPGAFWMGGWNSVNVVVWLRSADLNTVQRIERALVERIKLFPKMSSVHIVAGGAGPPQPDAKDALVEMNERLADSVACGAVVMERGGIVGVALRSAVTGIIIMAPKHYRIKVFDALEPCAPWVVEHHGKSAGIQLEPDELLQVLSKSRELAR